MNNQVDSLADLRKINLPFDVDEVEEQCHKCVRKQLKKYDKYINEKGKSLSNNFIVPCTGILKNIIPEHLLSQFPTDEEKNAALEAFDIVRWAAVNVQLPNGQPWKARWYQSEVLKCTSKRKVLRISRRAGKTDSVCIEILYHLFTTKKIKIVVAGPQKTHAEEIFTRLREFISNNAALANMVTRDVSGNYYEIRLNNGSRVRGFAAGAKGGGASVGIRGQDADRLYLEEMDYIDEKAITGAVFPILQTTPDTTLVGFSTPSGFRTPYYKCCEEDPQYVEFHYSYKVLPHWKAVEADKPQYTEEDWTHEFLAEWGSSEAGVYKPHYIDKALQSYNYSDMHYSHMWRYCIGIDWNEKHGTELVVVGFNLATHTYKVVESILVTGVEFTQLSGVAKVIELNKKWRPAFIYIDAGNGSTNYELLRKTAYDERRPNGDRDTARLLDILKKYDSGSSIPTKDPVTGKEIKMPAKPFMVNASIRMFEQGKIVISSADNTLEKQLRNYIIERYTPTKSPVYGMDDPKIGDHRLDALNLALVAFHLEFDDLHVRRMVTTVGIAPDPRTTKQSFRADKSMENESNRPEDRRLENCLTNSSIFGVMPGRVDSGFHTLKTNRRGWDNDTEAIETARWQQRKRSRRGNIARTRPSRSNF